MEIEFDPAKRELTLKDRGPDFLDAPRLFEGRSLAVVDDRVDYADVRFISYGSIGDTAIALVWTDRDGVMRIISMRRMHQEETKHVGLD